MFCTLNLFPRYSVKRSPTIILNKRENIQTLSSIFKTPLLYVATQLLCLLPCQPPKIQYPSSQHDRIFRHPTQTQNIIILEWHGATAIRYSDFCVVNIQPRAKIQPRTNEIML